MDIKAAHTLLDSVKAICLHAAKATEKFAAGDKGVQMKSDGSPVTAADLASNKILLEGLMRLTNWPIISEEGDTKVAGAHRAERYWLVDPLDGTKEFIKGLPEYTVNVALIEKARPVLGVITVPPTGQTYWAAKGCGAFTSMAKGRTPLTPADVSTPKTAVVSRSHLSSQTQSYLDQLGVKEVISFGSSIKLCLVAEGKADIYPRLGPIWYWDTAAGAAIAQEAGCDVIDLAGRPLQYDLTVGLKHGGFIIKPTAMAIPLPERA